MTHRISRAADLTLTRGSPTDRYREWRQGSATQGGILLVEFELRQYWLDETPPIALTAIYLQNGDELRVAVTDATLAAGNLVPPEQFELWLERHRLHAVTVGQPQTLVPEYVPKPWGQEIWYTGVEQRGVCRVGDNDRSLPIPWLQAVLPDAVAGKAGRPLVLLKILDPSPEEVVGDLYFELHEEKREIYVITRIDPGAWPDGTGYIRYGFDPDRVASAPSEAQFRRDYLSAVQAYETVRRQLDDPAAGGIAGPGLLERERVLRARMNNFTHMHPLQVGDVVVVPSLMPHSLQHGVRTVEFQTPVYERQILSFAQRVLSQDHWDTAAAVGKMRLNHPGMPEFDCLQRLPGLSVERVVDFPEFEVRRVRVEPGSCLEIPALDHYALVMVVEGDLTVAGSPLAPEQALLLPRYWSGSLSPAEGTQETVFLLALPRA